MPSEEPSTLESIDTTRSEKRRVKALADCIKNMLKCFRVCKSTKKDQENTPVSKEKTGDITSV